MNWMSLIDIITNIAAVIATIVAICTIFEMKKDREAARQPELVLRNGETIVLLDSLNVMHDWVNQDIYYNKTNSYSDNCYLTLENIGLGTAKDISIGWHFDETQVNNIPMLDNRFKIYSSAGEDVLQFSSSEKDISTLICSSIGEKNTQKIEFLSANHDGEYKASVLLPLKYRNLFSCFLFIYGDREDYHGNKINEPELTIRIFYKDIAGKKYQKEYKCSFQLINMLPCDVEVIDGEITDDNFESIPGVVVNVEQQRIGIL